MIFVTVGTQLPFDRMIRAIDEWAGRVGRTDVFAQIGASEFRPSHIEWVRFLSPDDAAEKIRAANLIVAHAGIGTIIAGLQAEKPMIILPRRDDLGEHRNGHQLATASRFGDRDLIRVAQEAGDIERFIEQPCNPSMMGGMNSATRTRLTAFLADLVSRTYA